MGLISDMAHDNDMSIKGVSAVIFFVYVFWNRILEATR